MKNKIYAHVQIHYSDHVYTATVRRIEDVINYLHNETRKFAISRNYKIFNDKNRSFQNRLDSAFFDDEKFSNHVSIFHL